MKKQIYSVSGYFIPVKILVCKNEELKVGDVVTVKYSVVI